MSTIKQIQLPDGNTYDIKPDIAKRSGIFYGAVDSTSTATVYTAQINGITEYYDGLTIILRNGVVTSTTNFTININSLGAKAAYTNMATGNPITPTNPTRESTIFNINYTMMFIYSTDVISGGGWICYRGYDANTNTIGYQLRTNNTARKVSDTARYYKIYFTSADGTHWVPASVNSTNNATSARAVNQRPIDPFGRIVYTSANTNYTAESNLAATTIWDQYNLTLGYSFNRTGAALTLTVGIPVYVKCAPQANGSAIMDATTPTVQALPSTDDGKIYIFLGIATSATAVELVPHHPVYYYKDNAIRLWTNTISSYIKPSTGIPATDLADTYAGSSTAGGNATRSNGILYGTVDGTSTATAFTATIAGVTEYYDGLAVMLKNGVISSASGFTININGIGAKSVYSNMAAATQETTIFNVNYTMLFVYDSSRVSGGGWVCYRGYDTNDNNTAYRVRLSTSRVQLKSATSRYRLLFTSADGQGVVPANNSTSANATDTRAVCQDKIDPFGPIYFHGSTDNIAAGSYTQSERLWQLYNVTLGYSFNRTGAALTLTQWKPVYIKCAPQSDGSAIMDATTPYTQALPSTEDGKIYIFLGYAVSATDIELTIDHPVYWYKDGAIRPWTNAITVDSTQFMAYNNPTGTGSLSINRHSGSTIGNYSVAVGGDTTASGTGAFAEGQGTTASGQAAHAEGGGNTASGDYSHAEGISNTAAGANSHVEGGSNYAYGASSHAEGAGTVAGSSTNYQINAAHAEGSGTKASGHSSHAEGVSTTASGNYSHAEGSGTKASGHSSHAEGVSTTASGNYSHAEGVGTVASGEAAHAEGVATIAQGAGQHVSGKYNIADSTSLEIIGNGDSSTRSNARTLDANGNEWTSGNVYVGGTSQSSGSTRLSKIDESAKTISLTAATSSLTVSLTAADGTTQTGTDSVGIKTINGTSLLGSGDLAISGLPAVTSSDNGKVLTVVSGAWIAASLPTYAGEVILSASGVNF